MSYLVKLVGLKNISGRALVLRSKKMTGNICKIFIGASGWQYGDWADGVFYPPDLSNKDWLKYYSEHFKTVEVNASFYHQMSAKTYAKWRETTPKDFIFSVKISRYLTHIKKLNEPSEPWQRFIENAKELKEKLGPILVQLPPNFKANAEKLEKFLKIAVNTPTPSYPPPLAGGGIQIALEARNESWFCDEIYRILKKYNAAMVLADNHGSPLFGGIDSQVPLTADFIYIRMHGPAGLYSSKYTAKHLRNLADKIRAWKKKAREIYVYFNNDTEGYAVENAAMLAKLL